MHARRRGSLRKVDSHRKGTPKIIGSYETQRTLKSACNDLHYVSWRAVLSGKSGSQTYSLEHRLILWSKKTRHGSGLRVAGDPARYPFMAVADAFFVWLSRLRINKTCNFASMLLSACNLTGLVVIVNSVLLKLWEFNPDCPRFPPSLMTWAR